jgi:ankyrin repeat protein
LLVENGADLDSRDDLRRTPLSEAAKHGCETVVRLLLEKGAEPDLRDLFGQTPSSLSEKKEYHGVVRLLLLGKDVDPVLKNILS